MSRAVRAPAEAAAWLAAAALSFWSFGFAVTRGSDLWWHLAAGRWAVGHGAVPRVDPFSFTAAGRPWLHDAWLSDVLLWLWVAGAGVASLAWWKWGLVVGTFVLLFQTLVRITAGDRLAAYLAALGAAAVAAPFLDVRPQLYSLLGLAVVLALTLGRSRPSRALPLVFLAWANLHAGVLLGLLCLPLVLLPALAEGDRGRRRALAALAATCAIACLANPNGLDVFVRPLGYAFDAASPFRTIGEWQPPFRAGGLRSPWYPWALAAFGLATVILVARRRSDATGLAAVGLGALTLAMSLRSRRFVPFFAVAGSLAPALVLTPALAPLAARLPRLAAPAAVALLAAVWLAPYPLSARAFRHLVDEESFPVETCDFIVANALAGDVFAYYNWGGYLTYRTGGRMRVYIDGRANMVFDDATYVRYVTVLAERPGWTEIVERSGASYVLWPRERRRLIATLLATGRWRPLHADAVSMLLVRGDHAVPATLVAPPPSAYGLMAAGVDDLERGALADAERRFVEALARDPEMRLACDLLARTQAATGRAAAGRATLARCERIFPLPQRLEAWRAYAGGRAG